MVRHDTLDSSKVAVPVLFPRRCFHNLNAEGAEHFRKEGRITSPFRIRLHYISFLLYNRLVNLQGRAAPSFRAVLHFDGVNVTCKRVGTGCPVAAHADRYLPRGYVRETPRAVKRRLSAANLDLSPTGPVATVVGHRSHGSYEPLLPCRYINSRKHY